MCNNLCVCLLFFLKLHHHHHRHHHNWRMSVVFVIRDAALFSSVRLCFFPPAQRKWIKNYDEIIKIEWKKTKSNRAKYIIKHSIPVDVYSFSVSLLFTLLCVCVFCILFSILLCNRLYVLSHVSMISCSLCHPNVYFSSSFLPILCDIQFHSLTHNRHYHSF